MHKIRKTDMCKTTSPNGLVVLHMFFTHFAKIAAYVNTADQTSECSAQQNVRVGSLREMRQIGGIA